jgi:thiol-disulfide isomerase/thioredoxin
VVPPATQGAATTPSKDQPEKQKPTTPTAATTPEALVAQAEQSVQRGDLDEAIRRLDQALETEPNHRKALLFLAGCSEERAGDLGRPASSAYYLKSARAIRTLRNTYQPLTPQESALVGPLLYNEACTYAIDKQPEKALDALEESIEAGFANAELMAEDPELASIRALPRFKELTRKIEQNAEQQAQVIRRVAGEYARALRAQTRPFAFRLERPDLDGKTVRLDDLKGKLILVQVWGTWCPPCRKELPHLKALLEKYRERGLAIVGINYERVTDDQAAKTVKAFVKEHQIQYPCLIGDDRTRDQIPDFGGYPTTLFLDRSGTVRVKAAGYLTFVDLDAIVGLLLESDDQVSGQSP